MLKDNDLRLTSMPFIVLPLQNDLHRLVLRQQSALSQKVLVVFGAVVCILFTGWVD